MEEKHNQQNENQPRAKDLLNRIQKSIGNAHPPQPESAEKDDSLKTDELIGKRQERPEDGQSNTDHTFSLEEFYGYTPLTRDSVEHEEREPKKRRERIRRTPKEQEKSPQDYEYDLMSIFGMEEREEEEAAEEEIFDEDEEDDGIPPEEGLFSRTKRKIEEYVDPSMKQSIFKSYRRRLIWNLADLALCLLLGVFVFAIEYSDKLPFALPGFLRIDIYPAVGVLLEIQVLVLVTAMKVKPFFRGGLNLILGHATPESVYFLTVLLTVCCYFMQLGANQPQMSYFGLVTLLSSILFSLYQLTNLLYEIRSFRILSAKRVKKVVHRMSKAEAKMEMAQMSRYLPYGNKYLSVQHTDQVDGYFKHLNASSASENRVRFLVFGSLLMAIAFALFTFFTGGEVYDSVYIGYITLMLALPLSAYFCCSYPMYMLSVRAADEDSAVIGSRALDGYLAPATITFSDADIFSKVSLSNFKSYGSLPHDQVICIAAAVLCPIGGLLGRVLEKSVQEDMITDDMEYLSVADDGIEAAVDGRHVLLGSYHYIVRNRLTMPVEHEMENSNIVHMFMAVDNEVAAHIQVEYTPVKSFQSTLKGLFNSGMTVVVKTFDPNVDLSLLCNVLAIDERQPIKVIHTEDPLELYEVKERVESPIVTLGGIRSLTETMRHAAKTRHVIGICTALAAVSIALSGVIMAAVLRLNDPMKIPDYYLALYQLFWLVPGIVISRLFS